MEMDNENDYTTNISVIIPKYTTLLHYTITLFLITLFYYTTQ